MLRKIQNLSLSAKIFGIVGLGLFGLITIASVSIWQMAQIGNEITEIAEQDIPLTESLTTVTIHQLEQAIALERAFRFGEEMAHSEHAREQFAQVVQEFEELAEKVDEELKSVETLASTVLAQATTDAARKEFQHVLDAVREIEVAHSNFDTHAVEALELLI